MNKYKSYRSDRLFVSPSFLIGMGSIFNIAGNYYSYNDSQDECGADSNAIASDWGAIGLDIRDAYENSKYSLAE